MSYDNQPPVHNDNHSPDPGSEDDNQNGPHMGIILIVVAVIVGLGWYLATTLRHNGNIQDCAMQGRTNCATIR